MKRGSAVGENMRGFGNMGDRKNKRGMGSSGDGEGSEAVNQLMYTAIDYDQDGQGRHAKNKLPNLAAELPSHALGGLFHL